MAEIKKVNFKQSLSVVIPLHNKVSNIESTLNQVIGYIESPDLQIIVIENGSTDLSKKVTQTYIDNAPKHIDINLYESPKGLGNALKEGFKYCKNEWIYFVPADFTFGNSEIFYVNSNNLYDKYDLFIGSKTHKNSEIKRSKSRKVYSFLLNLVLKAVFSIPYGDTQGTILFRTKIQNDIGYIKTKEFLFTTEFIVRAHRSKKNILEVPVVDLGIDTKSTVKPFRDGLKMLINIFKLKIQIIFDSK